VTKYQIDKIKNSLAKNINKNFIIKDLHAITGGCINMAYKLSTSVGDFFVKWNDNPKKDMFQLEVRALDYIRDTNTISVPNVISYDDKFIIMEFINQTIVKNDFWKKFAKNLADLHKVSNSFYGFENDNFIGSLHQCNKKNNDWSDFFINQRIIPQLQISSLTSDYFKMFDKLFIKLDSILPKDTPSLLHGDLWSGNFLAQGNNVFIIDPAIYFGNREMDIAMSKLFGGFDIEFYNKYNDCYLLEDGWEERVDLWNIYPLLVHYNLFGGSYLLQIRNILKYFI